MKCSRHSLPRLLPALAAGFAILTAAGCGAGLGPRKDQPAGAGVPAHGKGLFRDVAGEAGLRFTPRSGTTAEHLFSEITGSGCAFLDFDRDGWMDVLLLSPGPLAAGRSSSRNGLFRNRGGRFHEITAGSGLEETGYAQGVAVGDYDGDGFPDLYITGYGGNHLFHNEGGTGRFREVTASAGVGDLDQGRRYALGAAWGDYDRDGDLDLAVAHYAVWSPETDEPCFNALKKRGYCSPEKYAGDHPRLYRNDGGGRFTDVSTDAGWARAIGRGMGIAWLDYDGDGWQDLFIACDLMPNLLFRNTGQGRFTEVAVEANVAFGEMGSPLSGMGVAVGDYDGDGREDLHVTNFSHQPNTLFRNQEGGVFENASVTSGLAEPSNPLLGWGCAFLDYDLDGWQDLIGANGHIQEEIARLVPGLTYAQPKSLYHNEGDGSFRSVDEGVGDLASPSVSRGLAVADFDNDGRPDVLVNNQNSPAQLLHNEAARGQHWIAFQLEGRGKNRAAIHARLQLLAGHRRQSRVVRQNDSFCSSEDPRLYFGLGDRDHAEQVEVQWPTGRKARAVTLAADRVWRWVEGEPSPRAGRVGAKGGR